MSIRLEIRLTIEGRCLRVVLLISSKGRYESHVLLHSFRSLFLVRRSSPSPSLIPSSPSPDSLSLSLTPLARLYFESAAGTCPLRSYPAPLRSSCRGAAQTHSQCLCKPPSASSQEYSTSLLVPFFTTLAQSFGSHFHLLSAHWPLSMLRLWPNQTRKD